MLHSLVKHTLGILPTTTDTPHFDSNLNEEKNLEQKLQSYLPPPGNRIDTYQQAIKKPTKRGLSATTIIFN